MKIYVFLMVLETVSCNAIFAEVRVALLKPSPGGAQRIGTAITWKAKATNTNSSNLAFRFNVAAPGGTFAMAYDFNLGTHKPGAAWFSRPFRWVPTGIEGVYRIRVVAKDFTTGETASAVANFTVNPLVTGGMPVAVPTTNPLVALFSAPSCPAGSTMRVSFQQASLATPATNTNWVNCDSAHTMTFEIAGMYPATVYQMFSQTQTGTSIVNGPPVAFTTGALPSGMAFPTFTVTVPPGPGTDTVDSTILYTMTRDPQLKYFPAAIDLSGNILWYYLSFDSTQTLLTRPLPNGNFLSIEKGPAWNPSITQGQLLRQIDLAGNVVRETNTGAVQQELLAMNAADAQACDAVPKPAAIGAACLGGFHHDAIQTLPNGYSAVIADIEKIYPPGTQGDTTGLPVDIVGDMLVVLDANWQVAWYFDTFEHAGGAPQLDIDRPAVLGEDCTPSTECQFTYLLGPGIAPKGHDWLHVNTIYYWPPNGDLVFSSRHQDWIMKIDYQNGAGTGNILWRLGPCGDFTFNNVNGDPWPWFSHQHEVGIENGGLGPMTLFDNGNTRVAPLTGPHSSIGCLAGLGNKCSPKDCNSRGMALTLDESAMQVTPLLSQGLGVYAWAYGSAQLLENGNYYFGTGEVGGEVVRFTYSMEVMPPPTGITGTQTFRLKGSKSYRSWRMPSLYAPPLT